MNELIKLNEIDAKVLFTSDDEVKAIIDRIEKSARSIVFDVETAKGRKDIASIANKIARSKTYIDSLGKDYVSDVKASIKEIDNRRKTIRDCLDNLKEDVRKPLTEFENIEKHRIALIEENLSTLRTVIEYIPYQNTIETLNNLLEKSNNLRNFEFNEYQETANEFFFKISDTSESRARSIIETERLAAENERLKKEAEKAARKAREKEIAENARKEAEERVRKEEIARLDAERRALESEKKRIQEAEEARKRQAEEARQAKIREKETAERAERDKAEAIELARREEIKRQEEERKSRELEIQKREKDKAHRHEVESIIISQFKSNGITHDQAETILNIVKSGAIDNMRIIY